ncbi:MAG: sulfatase-like hydrolase/transferase, partial [Phycisphaerae bacterium]
MTKRTASTIMLSLIVTAGSVSSAACAPPARPNIILIVCDDLSPGILGFEGNRFIETPNIDRLAREGVFFSRAYVPLPQCAPSRAAILTGQFPHQVGVLTNTNARLPSRTRTIATALTANGYRCGLVGKWHFGSPHEPQAGFDDYWVTINLSAPKDQHYVRPSLWVAGKQEQFDRYLPELLTDHAIESVDRSGDKPFLLVLNYKTPHSPLTL